MATKKQEAKATTTKKQEAKSVEVVFVLDRSGSMTGLEADTIGGFNSTLKKQKKEEGEVIWSTVLFDDRHEVIHDRVPIEKVRELTEDDYYVRGSTALLDTIGRAVSHIGNVHKYAREEDVPDRTLFVITTDGLENSSWEYDYADVNHMIRRQQDRYGWEFIFLGANMDAVKVAGRLGIREERAARFLNDSDGISKNYAAVEGAMCSMRFEEEIRPDFLEDVRKDYRKRAPKK